MAGRTFPRTRTANDCGTQYENKMSALMAVRLYNTAEEFNIASNMATGGKFDDIVFSAKVGEQWQAWFIQLKHKVNLQKKISLASILGSKKEKDFNLVTYFLSYAETIQKLCSHEIFRKPNIVPCFVLFTNASLHGEVFSKLKYNLIDVDLLKTSSQIEKNIVFNLCACKEFRSQFKLNKPTMDSMKCFSKQFCFCVDKSNEEDIDGLVKAEIRIATGLPAKDADIIAPLLFDFIRRQHRSGNIVTKDLIQNFIDKAKFDLKDNRHDTADIQFVSHFLLELDKKLVPGIPILLKSVGDKTLMCKAALKQMGLLDYHEKSLKMVEEDSFKFLYGIWRNEKSSALVIDCECEVINVNENEVVSRLKRLAALNPQNKIILVVSEANQLCSTLGGLRKQTFNCTLKDLTPSSKFRLGEIEVLFQGHKTPLSSLVNETKILDDVFDMAAMTNLLLGRQPQVGIKPLEMIPYYVPRVLTRPLLSADLIRARNGEVFALSGISEEEAIRFLGLDESEVGVSSNDLDVDDSTKFVYILDGVPTEEFMKIASKKSALHWLHQGRKGLYSKQWSWRRSTGNIDKIEGYLMEASDYFPTDDIMKFQGKVVVVCAEPGMGKSTLLDHMGARTKSNAPHIWVVSVRLSDFIHHFSKKEFLRDAKKHVKNMIAEAAGVDETTSKFDKRLFNYYYDTAGSMVVLLDGFDEITPHYTEHGVKLIQVLQESKIARLLISTRPVWGSLLQSVASSVALTIQPFGPKEQKAFLKQYWARSTSAMDPTKLQKFVEDALSLIQRPFNNDEMNEFAGIPLQTRMIAEAFHPSDSLPAEMNGLQLFEKFIDSKFNIFFKEKSKTDMRNAHNLSELDDRRATIEEKFMQFGLLTLLPLSECLELDPPITVKISDSLRDYVRDGKERVGIILSFKKENPLFIHRTFAEYYVAKFFAVNFETNKDFLKSETFLSVEFTFVRYFFNRMLAKGVSLHEAVLNKTLNVLESIAAEECNSTDVFGRTALHLAASLEDGHDAIQLLLQSGADADIPDNLQRKPLDYALELNNINNVGILWDVTGNTLRQAEDYVPVSSHSLKLALAGDYYRLYIYLVQHDMEQDMCSEEWIDGYDADDLTLLHVAAWYNALLILADLLEATSEAEELECPDSYGRTPLLMAAYNGGVAAAQLLVENKANLLAVDLNGYNITQIAVMQDNEEMLKLALRSGKTANLEANEYISAAVFSLVANKTSECFKMFQHLMDYCPHLSTFVNKRGIPLFVYACIKGNPQIVDAALLGTVDVNMIYNGATPLIYAVDAGHSQVVANLLKAPLLNVDACNENGHSSLFLAFSKGNIDVVKRLVNHGASLTTGMPDGGSLVKLALESNNAEIIKILREKEVDFGNFWRELPVLNWTPIKLGDDAATSKSNQNVEDQESDITSFEIIPPEILQTHEERKEEKNIRMGFSDIMMTLLKENKVSEKIIPGVKAMLPLGELFAEANQENKDTNKNKVKGNKNKRDNKSNNSVIYPQIADKSRKQRFKPQQKGQKVQQMQGNKPILAFKPFPQSSAAALLQQQKNAVRGQQNHNPVARGKPPHKIELTNSVKIQQNKKIKLPAMQQNHLLKGKSTDQQRQPKGQPNHIHKKVTTAGLPQQQNSFIKGQCFTLPGVLKKPTQKIELTTSSTKKTKEKEQTSQKKISLQPKGQSSGGTLLQKPKGQSNCGNQKANSNPPKKGKTPNVAKPPASNTGGNRMQQKNRGRKPAQQQPKKH